MPQKKQKPDIWMPIYIGDYLSSTTRLSTEQHGAYLLLLMDHWKNGPLPNDDTVLAQIARMSLDDWGNARGILEAFFEVSPKHWKHKRVEQEYEDAQQRKVVASVKGKKGAETRWGRKDSSSHAPANASAIPSSNAYAMPKRMPADSSSPSPSPSKKNLKTISAPEGVSSEVWDSFVQQRHKNRAVITQTVINNLQREADEAGWSLEKVLEEIVARGWRGFKAEWVKEKQSSQVLSFAERDELAKRKRWEEMTGRKWPTEGETVQRLEIL